MESVIIGTAGHVDHGKTMLINALTGIDTDRLKEEKERGISIDLGFASFPLSGGRVAGIIDVPGHERFINNMLAGAAGIDLVLLVIDAAEGVMAQTREHLNILQLLGLKQGMVVITKIDTVDEDWCDLVEEEIREELKGTFLEDVPYCRVSSVKGTGIEDLKNKLDELTSAVVPRDTNAPMRLPVDRSFTISGFGTIVTGTLLQGKIKTADTVEILPSGDSARVRNLQVFSSNVEEAFAGQRVAVNLSGLERGDIERGSVVCLPGYFNVTSLIDVSATMLSNAPRGLKSLDPVHLYLGTSRVVARVTLLEKDILLPGETGLVQLKLESPLVAERKDHFIIRSYSPVTTIGGGIVLDPFSERRSRRARIKMVETLKELEQEIKVSGTDKSFVLQKLKQLRVADIKKLETATRLGMEKIISLVDELKEEKKLIQLGQSYLTAETFNDWENKVADFLESYHRKNPLSPGVPRAELKSVLPANITIREYDSFLEALENKGDLIDEDRLARADFKPQPTEAQQKLISKIEDIFKKARFQTPSPKELSIELKIDQNSLESILEYLMNRGLVYKITEDLFLHKEQYDEALKVLQDHFKNNETLTLAEFRDYLESSRKFMQPLLEFFDQKKITKRKGDYRILINLVTT